MNLLKDIAQHSQYAPSEGDLLKLFQAIQLGEQNLNQRFNNRSYFYWLFKELKERLLDGVLTGKKTELTEIQRKYFEIRKKMVQSITIYECGKKQSAIKLMKEACSLAKKYGQINIVLILSTRLEAHFSGAGFDKKEWTKYRDLTKAYLTLYNEELWIRSIYAELSIKVQSKDDITNIKRQLKTPNEANKEYMYRLYYYNALSLIARYQNDQIGLIETCKKAIAFFSKRTTPLPYTTKFTFQFQLIPIYLKQKKYADAHVIIKSCLVLPSSGSYSWHLTTLYKAVLGFYSGKPIIALNAYLEAQKALKKIKSNTIDSRWQIIEAYLYLFAKADLLKLEGKFRLYKFLNTVKPNQKGKHQVFVLHLLYLIFDGKKKEFMKECDNIEGYIHRHKSIPSRARYFLRLLHCVEKGDYNKLRVQAHAKKNLALLRSNARHLDIEVFDNEPVPFERLWGMVVDGLGK